MGIFNIKPDSDLNNEAQQQKESHLFYRTLSFFGFYYSKKKASTVMEELPPVKGLRLFFRLFFREFFTLIRINFLFYLLCVPIITIPAAYTAMTRVTMNMVRNEEYFLWETFWKTFRKEFKKSTIVGAALCVGLAVFIFAMWYYGSVASSNSLFWIPAVFAAFGVLTLLFVSFSLFPMIALADLPLEKCVKNAFLLIPLSIAHYFIAFAIYALLGIATILFFPESLILAIILYPSFFNLIAVFSGYGGIKKYVFQQ